MTIPDFDCSHYFTYAELTQFLQQIAAAYPNLIELSVIGQSYAGRDLWLATLTDQSTGPALEKPGYWIDANTHAGEVTGSAVALYTIHYLLTHYGQDPQVTRLLEGYTIYVLPRIAVDGAEKYLTTPYKLRSSVRPYPYLEPQEGLYEEDLNGDGLILMMRIEDPCGAWKISEQDPRIMRPREPEEFGGTYYSIMPEGRIRHFDGFEVKLAPDLEGMDFNRNYPHEWVPEGSQPGAGDFPFSEPETRAEAEFWRTHRNINGFVSYHTFSAVLLRPYSTHPDDHFPVEDLDLYKLIGKKGTEITGYPCLSVYHDYRYHPKQVVRGGMDDYGYEVWGWIGFTTELWDLPTAAGIEKTEGYIQWLRSHPERDDLQIMRWNDEHLGGRGFKNWQPFDHPQLGPVEIGGWDYKQVWQNAPAEYVPDLCDQHCRFTLAHALMSPRLAISRHVLTPLGSGLYHFVIEIENQGFLPTYTSQKALDQKMVHPIEVSLTLPEDARLITGKPHQQIPHLQGRSNKFPTVSKAFFPIGVHGIDYRQRIEWVIGRSGDHASPIDIQVEIRSERAGTIRTELALAADHEGADG